MPASKAALCSSSSSPGRSVSRSSRGGFRERGVRRNLRREGAELQRIRERRRREHRSPDRSSRPRRTCRRHHLVKRFAHRDRGARRLVEFAECARAVVDVAEHPEFRDGVPDAAADRLFEPYSRASGDRRSCKVERSSRLLAGRAGVVADRSQRDGPEGHSTFRGPRSDRLARAFQNPVGQTRRGR